MMAQFFQSIKKGEIPVFPVYKKGLSDAVKSQLEIIGKRAHKMPLDVFYLSWMCNSLSVFDRIRLRALYDHTRAVSTTWIHAGSG